METGWRELAALPHWREERPAARGALLALRRADRDSPGRLELVKAPGGGVGTDSVRVAATTEGAEFLQPGPGHRRKTTLPPRSPVKLKELAAAWNLWNAELAEPAWRPGGPRQTNAASQGAGKLPTPRCKARGNPGDMLSRADAPRIADRPLVVSAQIEPAAPNGVIVAQGGAAHGYALYLHDGKLAFAVRVARQRTVVTASEPLGSGRFSVEARLAAEGRITLSVNGRQVAEGRAPGLIAAQPARASPLEETAELSGDYTGPNAFTGKIENVNVR